MKRMLIMLAALLAPLSAHAQGYPSGIRSGMTGNSTATSTSTSAATPSGNRPPTRNLGTGESKAEGALGLTPQLQKELGISRQQ